MAPPRPPCARFAPRSAPAHVDTGADDPTGHDGGPPRSCRASPAKRRAGAGGQADPLTADDVAAIMATASLPRRTGRGMESEAAAADRDTTDREIVAVLFQGGLRRSEAAALRWADVQDAADGRGIVVYVRRSKNRSARHRGGRALPQERLRRGASPVARPAHRAAVRVTTRRHHAGARRHQPVHRTAPHRGGLGRGRLTGGSPATPGGSASPSN